MLFLDRERIFPSLSAERLLTCVLGRLQQARLQDVQLLPLGFHIDGKVDESVHRNISRGEPFD